MQAFVAKYICEAEKKARQEHNEFITPEHMMYQILSNKDIAECCKSAGLDIETLKNDLAEYFKDTKVLDDIEIEPEQSNCLVYALDNLDRNKSKFPATVVDLMVELINSESEFLKNSLDAQNFDVNKLYSAFYQTDDDLQSETVLEDADTGDPIDNNQIRLPGYMSVICTDDTKNMNINEFILNTLVADDTGILNKYADAYAVYDVNDMCHTFIIKADTKYNDLVASALGYKLHKDWNGLVIEIDTKYLVKDQRALTMMGDIAYSIHGLAGIIMLKMSDRTPVIILRNLEEAYAIDTRTTRELIGYLSNPILFKNKKNVIIVASDKVSLSDETINNSVQLDLAYKITDDIIENDVLTHYNEIFGGNSDDISGTNRVKHIFQSRYTNGEWLYKLQKFFNVFELKRNDSWNGISDAFDAALLYDGTGMEKYLKEMEEADAKKSNDIRDELGSVVFGQDKAINELSKHIEISLAGLGDEHKPIGSFLFVGPTGVGKTELARQLANNMGYKLLKYDMSEYSEGFTVARLLGSPAGYVGYGGHTMVDDIKTNPKSVVLLDEIEKADPAIYNLLLQIMDDATLTDGQNRKGDFSQSIVIMTSNAGASDSKKMGIGFGNESFNNDGMSKAVNRAFTPEFRGRLSAVIEFNELNTETYRSIIEKELNAVKNRINDKMGVKFSWSDDAIDFIARNIDTKDSGARQIAGYIKNNVTAELSHKALTNRDKKEFILSCKNDRLSIY